jgi:hypothetical protein
MHAFYQLSQPRELFLRKMMVALEKFSSDT